MKKKINISSNLSEILQKLGDNATYPCLLGGTSKDGWASRLAWNPNEVYCLEPQSELKQDVFDFIAKHQSKNHLVVGFISYNLGYSLQGLRPSRQDPVKLPNLFIMAYDNYLEKDSRGNIYANYSSSTFIETVRQADEILPIKNQEDTLPLFSTEWKRQDYHKAFIETEKNIKRGLIYQLNLTQKLKAKYSGNSRVLFNYLANKNQAKMMAYLEGPDFEILSMSPERFIKTSGETIETMPIKGTRPRGKNKNEDKLYTQELIDDPKEKAELSMITDLLRNDLSKVCKPGSVQVLKHQEIEKLTSVTHTYSHIVGELQPGISPFSALISLFPGGSVTGCPKKEAMRIIDELEGYNRGAYCGSIFVINENTLDSNILIRTVIKRGDDLNLSVGGGIVYDSVEEKEYQETLDKAKSIIKK